MTQPSQRYPATSMAVPQAQLEQLHPNAVSWRSIRHWVLPLAVLVTAVVLYLLQSSFATTSELEIARMAGERNVIAHHNTQLAAEVAALENPARIRERALALGLVEVSHSIRLTIQPAAEAPQAPAPSAAGGENTTTWQSLFNILMRWFAGDQ